VRAASTVRTDDKEVLVGRFRAENDPLISTRSIRTPSIDAAMDSSTNGEPKKDPPSSSPPPPPPPTAQTTSTTAALTTTTMTTTMSITSLTTTITTTMTTTSPTDIYQMCRLCLNTLKADEGESVFNNQVPSLPEKIYRVFGVSRRARAQITIILFNIICLWRAVVLLTGREILLTGRDNTGKHENVIMRSAAADNGVARFYHRRRHLLLLLLFLSPLSRSLRLYLSTIYLSIRPSSVRPCGVFR